MHHNFSAHESILYLTGISTARLLILLFQILTLYTLEFIDGYYCQMFGFKRSTKKYKPTTNNDTVFQLYQILHYSSQVIIVGQLANRFCLKHTYQ